MPTQHRWTNQVKPCGWLAGTPTASVVGSWSKRCWHMSLKLGTPQTRRSLCLWTRFATQRLVNRRKPNNYTGPLGYTSLRCTRSWSKAPGGNCYTCHIGQRTIEIPTGIFLVSRLLIDSDLVSNVGEGIPFLMEENHCPLSGLEI
jgi:hypothetical protein